MFEAQRLHWDILERFIDAAEQARHSAREDFNRATFNSAWAASRSTSAAASAGVRSKAFPASARGRSAQPDRPWSPALEVSVAWTFAEAPLHRRELRGRRTGARSTARREVRSWPLRRWSARRGCWSCPASGRASARSRFTASRYGMRCRGREPNLQDHPQLRTCVVKVNGVRTLNTARGELGGASSASAANMRSGQSATNDMARHQLGAYPALGCRPQARPNLEYHVQPAFRSTSSARRCTPSTLARSRQRAMQPAPRRRAAASYRKRRFPAGPRPIAPGCLTTDEDPQGRGGSRLATRGASWRRRHLPAYRPEEWTAGSEASSTDEALAEAAGGIGTTIFHPVELRAAWAAPTIRPGGGGPPGTRVLGIDGLPGGRCIGDAADHLGQRAIRRPSAIAERARTCCARDRRQQLAA
ncbi:hypothetical protein ACTMU2_00125 [Cupriavidus basilensis]